MGLLHNTIQTQFKMSVMNQSSPLAYYFPHGLAVIFTIFFIVLGIEPHHRGVWVAEVLPVVMIFGFLVLTFGKFRFSNLAYALMAFWMFWHTFGGHYTFALTPFDWFNDWIGSERNQFDRIGHFSVGFYAFAIAEWLLRKNYCRIWIATFFSLFAIMSVAAGYEIIEWWFAVSVDENAGTNFLGAQGDIWDAQKDMLMDTLGAFFALILFHLYRPDRR